MSYTGRHKYKSRAQRGKDIHKRVRIIAAAVGLFLLGLMYYKRVDIVDYLNTFLR